MALVDQVLLDVPTFTNVGEFGSPLLIDGVAMNAVLVNDEAPTDFDGVSSLDSTLYARMSDFAVEPEVRNRMSIGDRMANVMRVDEEQGMYTIRLKWFNS